MKSQPCCGFAASDLAAPSERQQSCREAISWRYRDGAALCIGLTAHRSAVRVVHGLPIDLVAYGSASLGVLRPRSAERAGECVHPRHSEREIHTTTMQVPSWFRFEQSANYTPPASKVLRVGHLLHDLARGGPSPSTPNPRPCSRR